MSGSNVSNAEQQGTPGRDEQDVQCDMVVHVEIEAKGVWMHFGCVELAPVLLRPDRPQQPREICL
jgi:hypothetical protein